MRILKQIWNDDGGALLATEWVFLCTLLVVGAVAGMKAVQSAVNAQLEEVSGAIQSVEPGYYVPGQRSAESRTAGSVWEPARETRIDVTVNGLVATPPVRDKDRFNRGLKRPNHENPGLGFGDGNDPCD